MMEETANEQTVESSEATTVQTENDDAQQLRRELSELQRKFDEWKQKAKVGVNELRQRAVELTEALRTSQQEREELEKRLNECEEIRSKKVEEKSDNLTLGDGAHHNEHNIYFLEEQLLSIFFERASSYEEVLMSKITEIYELLESNHKVMQTHLVEEFEVYKRRTAATIRLQSKNNEKLTQLLEELQKKLVNAEDALRANEIALRNRDDAISKMEHQLETCEVARKEMELEHMELIQSPNMNELNVMHDELERQVRSIREEYMTLEASLHIAHRNEVQRIKAEHEREISELQHQLDCVAAEASRHTLLHNKQALHNSKQSANSNTSIHQYGYKIEEKINEDYSQCKNDTSVFDVVNEATNEYEERIASELYHYKMKSEEEQLEMYLYLLNKELQMEKKYKLLQERLNDCAEAQLPHTSGVDTAVCTAHDGNVEVAAKTFSDRQKTEACNKKNTTMEAGKKANDMAQAILSNNSLHVKGVETVRNNADVNNYSSAANSSDTVRTKHITNSIISKEVLKKKNNRVQTNSLVESSASTLSSESVMMSDLTKLQSSIKLLKEELWNAKKENVKLKQSIGSATLPQGALDAQQVQYLRSVLIKILCNLSQVDVIKHLLPVVKTILHLPEDDMMCIYKCNPNWRVH